MTYGRPSTPRSFLPKCVCIILLVIASAPYISASDYQDFPLEYYREHFVPSLTHEPFARARSDESAFHAYDGLSEDHYYQETQSLSLPQSYLSFIAQEPVYPLHVTLLSAYPESLLGQSELENHSYSHLGTFSKNMKLYRFSSGCNIPVYLGASNVLFSEPLGSTFLSTGFDHVPVIATPEPATFLIYITLAALTAFILRRRTS